jgi:hypothetical protein
MSNKDYNKSMIFNTQQSPIFNFNKKKLFDPSNSKIDEEASKNSFKSKLKKIDKEFFNSIPKNDKLMNNTTILHKKSNNSNKDKQYYQNLLNEIYQNESHFDCTNIKKKMNESNIKVSSLIPISKKMINKSKEKFLKEEENLKEKEDILKKNKKHSRRKGSFNIDNKNNARRNSIKRKSKKYNSTHELIKVKKKIGSHNPRKSSEIGKIKDIIKDQEKTKKVIRKKDEDKDEEDNAPQIENIYPITAKEDLKNRNYKMTLIENKFKDDIFCVTSFPCGNIILSRKESRIEIYDENFKSLQVIENASEDWIYRVGVIDNNNFATVSYNGQLRIFTQNGESKLFELNQIIQVFQGWMDNLIITKRKNIIINDWGVSKIKIYSLDGNNKYE